MSTPRNAKALRHRTAAQLPFATLLTLMEKHMDNDLEARIRTRAYHLWENDPEPEGKAEQHWEEARRQIEAEGGAQQETVGDDADTLQQPADQSVDRDRGARIAPEQQLQEMPGGEAAPEPARRAKRQRAG
jgi:hypothetical protein